MQVFGDCYARYGFVVYLLLRLFFNLILLLEIATDLVEDGVHEFTGNSSDCFFALLFARLVVKLFFDFIAGLFFSFFTILFRRINLTGPLVVRGFWRI